MRKGGVVPISHLSFRISEVYERLLAAYGRQGWWPGDSPFEVVIGAILTQSAAWTNVERAIGNLKAAGALSPAALHRMEAEEIAALVRPSGYFNAKARKLKAFVEMLHERFNGHLHCLLRVEKEDLRRLLLDTHGIGPETADSIVLYAAGRPSFVIDAYTRRVFSRLGIAPEQPPPGVRLKPDPRKDVPEPRGPRRERGYEAWRAMFMGALPPDAAMFNEYHALVVRLGKEVCRKREPLCGECALREVCDYASGTARAATMKGGAN